MNNGLFFFTTHNFRTPPENRLITLFGQRESRVPKSNSQKRPQPGRWLQSDVYLRKAGTTQDENTDLGDGVHDAIQLLHPKKSSRKE